MEIKDDTQPELKDIIESIHRYAVVNKNDVSFIGSFIAYDQKKLERGDEDIIKDNAERLFAYGNREELLTQLHILRGMILEDKDEFLNW